MQIPERLVCVRFGGQVYIGISDETIVGGTLIMNNPRVLTAVTGKLTVAGIAGAPDQMYFTGGYAWFGVRDEEIAAKYIENTSGIKLAQSMPTGKPS